MTGIYLLLVTVTVTSVFAWPGEVEITPVPEECPSENSKNYTVHLAHKDCTKFCKCDHGVAIVMDCPAKLHFNKLLQVCDRPAQAKCDGKGTASGQCGGEGSDESTTSSTPTDPPTCVDGETSAHECSCEKYYLCKDGEYVLKKCNKGDHYSKKKKKCTRASKAGCISKKNFY